MEGNIPTKAINPKKTKKICWNIEHNLGRLNPRKNSKFHPETPVD
jgi:hypothetical protein